MSNNAPNVEDKIAATRRLRRMRRWGLKRYPDTGEGAWHWATFTLFAIDEAVRADPSLAEYLRTLIGGWLDGRHLPRIGEDSGVPPDGG